MGDDKRAAAFHPYDGPNRDADIADHLAVVLGYDKDTRTVPYTLPTRPRPANRDDTPEVTP